MGHGSIVFEGTPGTLLANAEIRKEWLGLSGTAASSGRDGADSGSGFRAASA